MYLLCKKIRMFRFEVQFRYFLVFLVLILNELIFSTASRRYEAAGWLRKMVGVVAAKDLPAEPSEEEFRLGLRSGIILCNVLNKVQPGAVPKVNLIFSFIIKKNKIVTSNSSAFFIFVMICIHIY